MSDAWAMGVLFCVVLLAFAPGASAEPVSFNRDVRPIFREHCVKCHGGVKQASGLSFLHREQLLAEAESGEVPVVPGKLAESEVFARVTSDDEDVRMPPADHGPRLSQDEIDLLRRWIEEGAPWEQHWAFRKPRAQELPAVKNDQWCRNRMDWFILARLEAEGLSPSPEAPKAALLRRVTFDLTGLPPSIEEMEAFLDDPSPDAYESAVDRLLDSKSFGERWAAMWLDLARYADTMGFEKDLHRIIWPYRDYVIRSFNEDKPFDRFTIEQLAGDLLTGDDAERIVATAFHRNTQNNTEGGTDDEEFRIAAVIDRVSTTWQVWQGQTFQCTQCHHHPYDAFRHEDFYRFLALFNSTEDADLNNEYPRFELPHDQGQRSLAVQLDREIRELRETLNARGRELAEVISDWQPLDPASVESSHGQLSVTPEHEIRASGTLPVKTTYTLSLPAVAFTALRVEIIPETDDPAKLPERGSVLSHLKAELQLPDGKEESIDFREVFADTLAGPFDPMDSLKGSSAGFGGFPKLYGHRWAVFVADRPIEAPADAQLRIAVDHKAMGSGLQAVTLRRFALSASNDSRWTELVDEADRLEDWDTLDVKEKQRKGIKSVSLPVVYERPPEARRETRIFIRGNFLNKDRVVEAGVPEVFPPLPSDVPADRLALARWLVSADNPLTARVMVNRFWSELFGAGIVETVEDFGAAGQLPSHPELLDDLAVQFQTVHHYSMKQLLREIVTSATYRQDARVTPELVSKDPNNRLLARGPRCRLTAEMVRDQALAASGLLSKKMGGPSVMPYQPDGVWQTIYNNADWTESEGEDRYRRSLYTYWRRTSPYPSAMMFDAPSREICTGRRISTNTPLQALVTLNDPVYVEAARALARREGRVEGATIEERIRYWVQLATSHPAEPATVDRLVDLYHEAAKHYASDPDAASELGDGPEDAARVVVASTILNMDRVFTK